MGIQKKRSARESGKDKKGQADAISESVCQLQPFFCSGVLF